MKFCNNCRNDLPLSSFGSDKTRKDNKSIYCLQCRADLARTARYAKPERGRSYSRFKRYGITKEQYDDLFDAQNGRCAICGTDKPGRNHPTLYVDHDHNTGKVRGLLCCDCNLFLGQSKESIDVLKSAIDYLVHWGQPSQP
jgi:hypothetical protein